MVSGRASEPSTGASLRQLLHEARDRGFVGRAEELATITDSLAGSSTVRVHFVHGPGGIGKTSLLDAVARDVRRAGGRATYIDAREVACSKASVTAAVAELSGGSRSVGAPDVLLVDGYELLDPLDRWFREELLPHLAGGAVAVLASRDPPHPRWRLDPGWQRLARVHELGPLHPGESDQLLAGLGMPEEHRPAVLRLGHGHPLALVMLAEAARARRVPAGLEDAPDVVAALCRTVIDDVPDAAHRAGLATCAHATRMTHDLLVSTVGPRADEIWDWLASRPYVRRGSVGLFLHDVVREIFEAELAHRAPAAYTELHNAVKGHFLERLADPSEPHPHRAAAELLLLHRKGPLAEESRVLRDAGLPAVTLAAREEHEGILALVEAGEGPESAGIARRWIGIQPEGLYRVRSDADVVAFGMHVYLDADGPDVDDPVATAIRSAVARHGPLRPGERINVNRFAGASGAYQRDPMLLLANGVSCILEWGGRSAAWTFMTTIDPEHYGPYFSYLGLAPLFTLDYFGRPLAGYGWDRRRFPVSRLFDMMSRRELSGESGPPPGDLLRPAPMSRERFEAEVRAALTQLDRPDRLRCSPLLGTALVEAGDDDPVAELRDMLTTAIAGLTRERHGAEHRRVLERTYLHAVPSQEAAAHALDLPFSTYRRHLGQAQQRLVEVLWAVEVGQQPPPRTPV